jgi:hypothetical protein
MNGGDHSVVLTRRSRELAGGDLARYEYSSLMDARFGAVALRDLSRFCGERSTISSMLPCRRLQERRTASRESILSTEKQHGSRHKARVAQPLNV